MEIMNGRVDAGNSAPDVVPRSGRYTGTALIGGAEKSAVYDQLLFSDGGMVHGTRRYGAAGGHTFEILGVYDAHAKVYRWTETIEGRLLHTQVAGGSAGLHHAKKFITAITD
eukprot:evm.model.scf_2214.1 EVM.evm.TU.scf_2214.1   scf_2214:22897-24477(+)